MCKECNFLYFPSLSVISELGFHPSLLQKSNLNHSRPLGHRRHLVWVVIVYHSGIFWSVLLLFWCLVLKPCTPPQAPHLLLSPGVCSSSCPSSQWCCLTISSSAALFSFCFQSFPASGSSYVKSWTPVWKTLIYNTIIHNKHDNNFSF